jgi:hypothetical protein
MCLAGGTHAELRQAADTARKALNRLSICIKQAAALGLDVDIQAT